MSQPLVNPNGKEPKEKSADSRHWYQKKRWILPIGFLVFSSFLSAISGGDSPSDPAATQQSEQVQQSNEPTEEPSAEPTVAELSVPDVVGKNTEDAIAELATLGFSGAVAQDATYEERNVFVESNWFVCETKPAPGDTMRSDQTLVLLSVKNSEVCPKGQASETGDATQGEQPSSGDSRFGNQPKSQLAMLEVVSSFQDDYDQAKNDLQRGNVRLERDEAVCKSTGGSKVSKWSGVVEDLGATSEGLGYVKIAIGPDVTLETWNNELSDIFDETLVERGTALYKTILGLSEGQVVTFSGSFVGGDGACLDTKNLTEFYAMRSPEFVFRFSQINP